MTCRTETCTVLATLLRRLRPQLEIRVVPDIIQIHSRLRVANSPPGAMITSATEFRRLRPFWWWKSYHRKTV